MAKVTMVPPYKYLPILATVVGCLNVVEGSISPIDLLVDIVKRQPLWSDQLLMNDHVVAHSIQGGPADEGGMAVGAVTKVRVEQVPVWSTEVLVKGINVGLVIYSIVSSCKAVGRTD